MIRSGVSRFDGIGASWYGWAQNTVTLKHREGPNRLFRFHAWLDSRFLRRWVG